MYGGKGGGNTAGVWNIEVKVSGRHANRIGKNKI